MSGTIAAGRYRIERELGRGGMATVYLAHDEELDRRVAIKVLPDQLASDADFRARFLREARLASRLSHPNVVQVYDAGETYIVMEYVHGRSLAASRRLAPERVVRLGAQACAGLQHAHDAGLLHRDIKPANLLVRDDGVLKIADFGIARAADSTRHTQAGTLLGTAAYLAPELLAGEDATRASDVYALGAVLYELLTGRPPYTFRSLGELAAQQAGGMIEPVCDLEPSVPSGVEAAVMHALARDSRFRPESAAELGQELAAAPTRRPTEPLAQRVFFTLPGRGAWLWLAATIVVASVAVVLGLTNVGGGDEGPPPGQQRPQPLAPPAAGATAEQQARNLARWLRAHSG